MPLPSIIFLLRYIEMSIYAVLLMMFWMHVVDDFFIQSQWLVNGKQKSWWEENAPQTQYRYDYIMCLFVHGMSWVISVMIPPILTGYAEIHPIDIALIVFMGIFHAIIDHRKANKFEMNLISDQCMHFIQIMFLWAIYVAYPALY